MEKNIFPAKMGVTRQIEVFSVRGNLWFKISDQMVSLCLHLAVSEELEYILLNPDNIEKCRVCVG